MVTGDKKGHCMMIKGVNTTIVNTYTQNIRSLKHLKQMLTDPKREIDNITIIVDDFNILLSAMGRSSRQKIHKEMVEFNHTLKQMNLADIHGTFHPIAAYILYSQIHTEHSPGWII